MKDLGVWGVRVERAGVYFTYRDSYIGKFEGDEHNARYMVACINAALRCWSSLDDEIEAERLDGAQ